MTAEAAVPPQSDILVPDVIRLMAVGGDFLESRRAAEFARVIDSANFAVGVHPHQAAAYLEEKNDFGEFRGMPKLAAIGELGLDYYYELSDREAQKKVFRQFLELGLEWDLPAIVHIRDREGCDDAYRDACELLDPFAGNIRETLRVIPDERLLIETDSPYLAPVPHRGRENHPGYLVLIADRVAQERGRPVREIVELTTANGRRFFRI